MTLSINSVGRSHQHSPPSPRANNHNAHNEFQFQTNKSEKSQSRYYQVKNDPQGNKATMAYESIASVNKKAPSDSIAGFDAFV